MTPKGNIYLHYSICFPSLYKVTRKSILVYEDMNSLKGGTCAHYYSGNG